MHAGIDEFTLLAAGPPKPVAWPRDRGSILTELRGLHGRGELELPLPAGGQTVRRWAALAGWGRRDLTLARLAEGHIDALAILAEAGHAPAPGALYGVWASRSGTGGPSLRHGGGHARRLEGTCRFCSGARELDRALISATPQSEGGEPLLVEVSLADPGVRPVPGSWQADGMDASDTLDVCFHDVPVPDIAVVGGPGFYTRRAGFALGGAGVAAVWLGGAAGLADDAWAHMQASAAPDPHRLAHYGAIHTQLAAVDALLASAAATSDTGSPRVATLAGVCRAAAERVATEALERVPKILGPAPLAQDPAIGARIADLGIYIRQHHGERDLAALGEQLLAGAR